jgi:hypothetical protein
MKNARIVFVTVVLAAAACAAAVERPSGVREDNDRTRALASAERDLQRQEAEIDTLATGSLAVDCVRARLLRDNVCGLATRICLLARDPAVDAGSARCADARERCKSARVRVAGPCPEPTAP